MVTPASDTGMYNLMFFTDADGRLLLYSFNGVVRDGNVAAGSQGNQVCAPGKKISIQSCKAKRAEHCSASFAYPFRSLISCSKAVFRAASSSSTRLSRVSSSERDAAAAGVSGSVSSASCTYGSPSRCRKRASFCPACRGNCCTKGWPAPASFSNTCCTSSNESNS